MTNRKIGQAVGNVISAPVGLCTCKVVMDVTTNLLPPAISVPLKIAYNVGTVGVGLIGTHAINKIISGAIDEVCDAMDEIEEDKKKQKQIENHLKEVGA